MESNLSLLGKLGGIPSDGISYPVFIFCALLSWRSSPSRALRVEQQSGRQSNPDH